MRIYTTVHSTFADMLRMIAVLKQHAKFGYVIYTANAELLCITVTAPSDVINAIRFMNFKEIGLI